MPCSASRSSIRRKEVRATTQENRFEIPEQPNTVIDQQVVYKRCPQCGHDAEGSLPKEVESYLVQNGPSFQAQEISFRFVYFIPYNRLSQFCRTLFGMLCAQGTAEPGKRLLPKNLVPFEKNVWRFLIEAGVLSADETGLWVAGFLSWTHVAATEGATLLGVFPRRGKKGIDDLGVLMKYTIDFEYACGHALRGAHILRELRAAFENGSQGWARELSDLLSEMNRARNATPEGVLSHARIDFFRNRYLAAPTSDEAKLPPPEPGKEGAGGRMEKFKTSNFHDRLARHEEEVLLFINKPEVPFTKHLAERALRMLRLLQKISEALARSKAHDVSSAFEASWTPFGNRTAMVFCCCGRHTWVGPGHLSILKQGRLDNTE